MISHLLEIFFLLLSMTISYSASKNVALIAEYSPTYMILTCKVKDIEASSYMIHLSCPLVKKTYCYSNCTGHCTVKNRGACVRNPNLSPISGCQYTANDENNISTSYQIITSEINITGDWTCSYKNYKSNSVSLTKYEQPTTTTRFSQKTIPSELKNMTKETKEIIKHISTESISTESWPIDKRIHTTQAPKVMNEPSFLDYVTRPESVLVLLLLLGISLLLNLSFLVRCVLLKSVIENYYRGIPNSQCILECLCLDLVSNKYTQKRYSRSLNLSNQVVGDLYRCQAMCTDNMAIYDDLSAVSNSSTRMKMRSNQTPEMDEETRLTNLIPNGSCHINQLGAGSVSSSLTRRYTNPGHAAYFHPGLGNYVIVSGPVATHDQFSVGTSPSGYAIQMVSPIPSAPGSIGGGLGTHNSASSAHSDDSDNDSRVALSTSMATSLTNYPIRVNSQPIDLRDSSKMIDFSQNIVLPINGLDQPLHYHHENNKNFYRLNGSVPLHPWPRDSIIPTTSSISSLPFCILSENGACNQDLRNKNTNEKLPTPPKDIDLIKP